MITILLILTLLLAALFIWFFIFPVRYFGKPRKNREVLVPPDFYVYSFVLHIHTQYSFDSLGKPEDILSALREEKIDFAIVTDHDNTDIGRHDHDSIIAGKEVKLNDEEGNLLGDILEVEDLKVIAHHFREKYRWRLSKDKELFFELIDLRDALFQSRVKFFLYVIAGLLILPLTKKIVINNLKKLVNTLYYAQRYLEEGWQSRVLGGHDHHVLLYLRDVKTRFLFPDYRISFRIMRNVILSKSKVTGKDELIKAIKEGFTIISFSERNSYQWIEDGHIMATSPYQNTLFLLLKEGAIIDKAVGSNYRSKQLEKGYYMLLGFTYGFHLGGLFFDVRPLFVSDLIGVHQ